MARSTKRHNSNPYRIIKEYNLHCTVRRSNLVSLMNKRDLRENGHNRNRQDRGEIHKDATERLAISAIKANNVRFNNPVITTRLIGGNGRKVHCAGYQVL